MMSSASNCFRIGSTQWLPEQLFTDLLDLLDLHRASADELTFFTSDTHPPLPLDTMQRRMEIVADRMAAARERGWRTGINILSTIGHHEENQPHSLDGPYQRMVDSHGVPSMGVFCPNDERLRDYIREIYGYMVEAEPAYIWIDDDVRLLGHKPIMETCFCDFCLTRFSETTGTSWTRGVLRAAFDIGPVEQRLNLRRRWLQHNRDTIDRLFALIEETVHSQAPDIVLGFMTGDRFFEGYDFARWADTLSGEQQRPVLWRPGGGTYTDERLDDTIDKAHDIGRQTSLLPEHVQVIQSEIENFPYQRLMKSERATVLESAAYIAAGCTGAAYNVLSMYSEPLDEYGPLLRSLSAARPFLDKLVATLGRAPSVGIASGWCADSYVARSLHEGGWFGGSAMPGTGHTSQFHIIGLPPAYAPSGSDVAPPVTALSGDAPLALGDDTVEAILSAGTYLDGPALKCLNDMGYRELTGFDVGAQYEIDSIEELCEHPLNGPYAGRQRNRRQSFWPETAYELIPSNGCETLARIVDYVGDEIAPCCSGVFENSRGGRIAVSGYSPWSFLQNEPTARRIKTTMRWLSRDTLPGWVASYHRTALWLRELQSGNLAGVVLNASLDPADGVRLMLHTSANEIHVTSEACDANETCDTITVASTERDGPYSVFQIPHMPPWSLLLINV
jgi:hypothetical protein